MTDFSDFGGELHLGDKVMLFNGDSREVLKLLPDASIDSVVTDPPYALVSIVKRFGGENAAPTKDGDVYSRASAGFMGKQWDTGETAFAVTFWAEVMRVLKPGGHVIAASGTRTYHRLAVAIEDAGFEIRDSIQWVYASGFPKSHNIINKLKDSGRACPCHKTIVSSHYVSDKNLHDLRLGLDSEDALSTQECNVQPGLRRESDFSEKAGREEASIGIAGDGSSQLHGLRSDVLAEREALGAGEAVHVLDAVQRSCARGGVGGARSQGRESEVIGKLCQGGDEGCSQSCVEGRGDAQACAGELHGRPLCEGTGVGAPDGSQGRLCDGASASDGAPVRLPADARGNGSPQGSQSSEQPSDQSGIVADKRGPQAWGGWPVCGGCLKPVVPEGYGTALKPACEPWVLARKPLVGTVAGNVLAHGVGALNIDGARIKDGTETGGEKPTYEANHGNAVYGAGMGGGAWENTQGRWPANAIHDGSEEVEDAFGEACRFFYSAKADAMDRIGSKHPTVKPVDLMQYLCRLITPPGGIVLDPFAGSGTTGEAAWREGFRCVLIEREAEYSDDIRERMKLAPRSNAMKRKIIATKKAGDLPQDGLFSL